MRPIAKMLIQMAKYYDQPLAEDQLEMYVEVLSQQPEELVLRAGKEYIQNPRNKKFPMPPHIILEAYLPSEPDDETLSKEIAGRIVDAITRFGWNNSQNARTYIGEIGWGVVDRFGGWITICESHGASLDPTSFYAQARDLARSHIELSKAGMLNEPIDFPSDDRKRIEVANARRLASTVREIEGKSNRPLTPEEIARLRSKIEEITGLQKKDHNHGNLTVAGDLIKTIMPEKEFPK